MPTIFESPAKPKKPATGMAHQSDQHPRHRANMGPFTAFAMHPQALRFETQEKEEEVILFLRQHVIVLVPWALLGAILIITPSFLFPFLLSNIHLPFTIPPGYLVIGTLFWYLATFGLLLSQFLKWYFNIYVVTDERVVDIDFVNLLYKEFSEARLAKIQDITFSTGGILAAIFNYGNVIVQTAGELPNFEFISVPRPDMVVQTISELAEKARNSL